MLYMYSPREHIALHSLLSREFVSGNIRLVVDVWRARAAFADQRLSCHFGRSADFCNMPYGGNFRSSERSLERVM
jgi:hypothetical protein